MKKVLFLLSIGILFSCNTTAQKKVYMVSKTNAEWKKDLSVAEYYVLREAGTERPFSSKFNNNKKEGTYVCTACNTALYKSKNKFDDGPEETTGKRHCINGVALKFIPKK